MGNCQAVEAATLVIQFPSGKTERLYWSITASEVMMMNPGHYVSLIIPVDTKDESRRGEKGIWFTRIKLLRSSETLMLGVTRVLRERSYEKMRRSRRFSDENTPIDPEKDLDCEAVSEKLEVGKSSQSTRHERYQQWPTPAKYAMTRSKLWCPSLQSISEGGSLQ